MGSILYLCALSPANTESKLSESYWANQGINQLIQEQLKMEMVVLFGKARTTSCSLFYILMAKYIHNTFTTHSTTNEVSGMD